MNWGELIRHSLIQPRAAARTILGLGLGRETLVPAALLVACFGTLVAYGAAQVVPPPQNAQFAEFVASPILATAMNLCQLAVLIWLAAWVGQRFGGDGTLAGAAAVVIWYDLLSLVLVGILLTAIFLLPPLGVLLGIGFIVWLVWAPAAFVAELHGFRNALIVFGGIVLVMLALLLMMSLLQGLLGVAPTEGS